MTTPETAMPFTPAEIERYGRHLVIPEVGVEGQRALSAAAVLLVGAGGLGSPLAQYLAAAGVGRLGIVDFDRVEASNLQRQTLFGSADVGRVKVEVAAERLRSINPHIRIEPHPVRLDESNARRLVESYDLVADGSDNFPTRYLVNDACVMAGRTNVYGSVFRFEGQVSVLAAPGGSCYRCLFPEPPPAGLVPSCAEAGVLGVLPGIIGALQANEVVKLVVGIGEPLVGRFVIFDALGMRLREVALPRNPSCPVCGDEPTITELASTAEACEEAPVAAAGEVPIEIDPAELDRWRRDEVPHALVDVRGPAEAAIARIEGARLVPLHELPQRTGDLEADRPLVVYCHHGIRSLQAVRYLRDQGFPGARSLAGGIDRWTDEVDPALPRY